MFLAGMEIDFTNLNVELPGAARAGGTQTGNTATGGRGRRSFGPLSLSLVSSPWVMALIMSTTSLGVVMPVLKEQGLIRGRFGQTILIAALIADFATMLLITVVVALISHGLTLDILLISVLFVVFFRVTYLSCRSDAPASYSRRLHRRRDAFSVIHTRRHGGHAPVGGGHSVSSFPAFSLWWG